MMSFPENANFSKIMLLSLEKGEINILLLPKQYKSRKRKKNKPLCPIPQQLWQRCHSLAMRCYIGKGKLVYFSNSCI